MGEIPALIQDLALILLAEPVQVGEHHVALFLRLFVAGLHVVPLLILRFGHRAISFPGRSPTFVLNP